MLKISDEALPDDVPVPASMWVDTEAAWRRAVPPVAGTLADRDATHARAVLRGMTEPGGGMVAAATMSLPERAAQGRNYDYRYVSIRDQAIAGQAAAAVGATDLLRDAVSFATARLLSDGPSLAPAYTVERADRWRDLADRIVADTEKRCTRPGGRWQRAEDDRRVDAALLLPYLRDPSTAGQQRMVTMRAVERHLVDDFYVYRFRHDDGELADTEGAFLLCGFAMAMAQHRSGDRVAAARYFERNRTACGPPGLFPEEYDVLQRQMRGNIPQAFVHAMLLESAARLAR